MYSNLQGGKNGKCPFYHSIEGSHRREKGNIVQMECDVKFYFFTPKFNDDGKPTTKSMAVLSFGEHTHPPPPPRKIPRLVKDELIKIVQRLGGATELTARRIIASPTLSIMLNGKTALSEEHIALSNQDAVNHLIRKERLKEHPWGTDFQGAQYLMNQHGLSDPYIRQTLHFPDGHFVVLCQFTAQSELFYESYELQADKTFSRTKCQEFEMNSYSHATKRTITLSRVFTDYEDEEGYYQAFSLVFNTAEANMGRKLPWGHLFSEEDAHVNGSSHTKAVLVDEHGGQCKGLGRYFHQEYQMEDADWHVLRIVRTCRVHYERSLHRLENKGIDKGIRPYKTLTNLLLALCNKLRDIPTVMLRDHYNNILSSVRQAAEAANLKLLLNWLDHKDHNPWILQCLSFATTGISRRDWFSTSATTNIAESAHAQSQRDGTRLSLVAAIRKGMLLDSRFFESTKAQTWSGVAVKYGNNSMTGRA